MDKVYVQVNVKAEATNDATTNQVHFEDDELDEAELFATNIGFENITDIENNNTLLVDATFDNITADIEDEYLALNAFLEDNSTAEGRNAEYSYHLTLLMNTLAK